MITGNRADVIVDDLLRQGYSRIPLTADEAPLLAAAFAAGAEFFAQDVYELKRFSGSSTNHGYRAFGDEYSISPDRPDQNDSFSLWADETSTIPNADEIGFESLMPWEMPLTITNTKTSAASATASPSRLTRPSTPSAPRSRIAFPPSAISPHARPPTAR